MILTPSYSDVATRGQASEGLHHGDRKGKEESGPSAAKRNNQRQGEKQLVSRCIRPPGQGECLQAPQASRPASVRDARGSCAAIARGRLDVSVGQTFRAHPQKTGVDEHTVHLSPRSSFIRFAQLSEIELFHFEERLRHARDLLGRAVSHHCIHLGRNDLP